MSHRREVKAGGPYEQQIYHERLRMFCDQICASSQAYFFWVAALLAILWFAESDTIGMVVWTLAAIAAEIVKVRVLKSFLKLDDVQGLSGWEWRIAGAMFSEGLIVSAGVALLLDVHAEYALFSALFLICATAYTSAMYHIASLRTYYAWATSLLTPWALKLLMSDNEYYWILSGIMVIGSISYIPVAAKVLHKYMIEALRLRHENLDLLAIAEKEKNSADKANADKTRFLASASHDLRQPMQAMALYLEVLAHRLKQAEYHDIVESLQASHASMGRIMDSLLDISKLDAGVVEVNLEPIHLDMMIDQMVGDYSLSAQKKHIRLRMRLNGAVVQSDLVMLECVLNNLISNAIRYTESEGTILVASRRRQGKVVVEVWDTGIGIPQDQLENIFTEFYQLDNPERDRQKGLGLGLSIVRRMVQLLPDHDIELTSRMGRGSCFRISLPEVELKAVTSPCYDQETEQFDGMCILMLEDDPVVRRAAVILMQEWACEVADVGSISEALTIVEQGWTPDVMIADYRLQGNTTGLQAVKEVRAQLEQHVPALIITGETGVETILEIANADIMLLHKPVVPGELKSILNQFSKKISNL
ncbi:response regulator [Mariprofundus sp. EBB-1]|uniref:ATP-binding response regulator n=1 Tax=Mariprofundus sp. EBB-1 TaxID=2650971 RepID=UPI000EF17974|nr:hybrid sensor histidine kinase/response regulator [Mariprofundus sp. EBB-1]RLL53533.1 response regulator [Mariprofundus sp. EBB-1]